jgi:hypothetical protein
MRSWMVASGPRRSSQLLRTGALRAADRLGIVETTMTDALDRLALGPSTFLAAGRLLPPTCDPSLRCTWPALELGADLRGVVTCDARTIESASLASSPVVAPT